MTNTAMVAISRNGSILAKKLAARLADDVDLYLERRFHQDGDAGVAFDLPVRPLVQRLFNQCRYLVLFMPVGAAVRLLAPSLRDKHADPAVVCVDDAGRFVVSLLSGHLGGADLLAQEVADALEATAVITSGSHVTGTLAVDLLGHELGWKIKASSAQLTRASAAMVNSEPVGIYQEAGESDWWPPDQPMPPNVTRYSSMEGLMEAPWHAALIITDRRLPQAGPTRRGRETWNAPPVVVYHPPTLVAGMGCRRGVPLEELEELLVGTFESHNLAVASLRCIATAELKREEPGILRLAEKHGVPVLCYSTGELNAAFGQQDAQQDGSTKEVNSGPTRRPRVHRLLGMWGVSEPAALLAAGNKELLVSRVKTSRATIAVARLEF